MDTQSLLQLIQGGESPTVEFKNSEFILTSAALKTAPVRFVAPDLSGVIRRCSQP